MTVPLNDISSDGITWYLYELVTPFLISFIYWKEWGKTVGVDETQNQLLKEYINSLWGKCLKLLFRYDL